MSHFCTMCEEYYNDPNKHRYIECMYYNGCDCGEKNPGRRHIRVCPAVRDRKRKVAESRMPAPLLSNSRLSYPEEAVCAMCQVKYRGSASDHRTYVCAYYNGCPHCKKRYFEPNHMKKCEEEARLKEAGFDRDAGSIKYKCASCNEYIESFKYDAHIASCKGEVEAKDDDETKVFPAAVVETPKTLCPFCLLKISDEFTESHQKSCFESVERKFSYNASYYGEPQVIDVRVKKGERAVRFQEGASH